MTEKKSVLKGTKAKAKESPKKKIEALPVAPSLTSSLPIAPSLTQINTAPISTPLAIATSLSTSTAIPVTITKPVGAPTGRKSAPTVADIILDPITQIASQHWGPDFEGSNAGSYDEEIVRVLFKSELQKGDISRLQVLELSGYLENYLWKHYSETSCFEHTFSILMMVNEKFREGIPVFEALTVDPDKFRIFFKAVVSIAERFDVSLCAKENEALVRQYVIYIHFLVNTFRSLEDPVVRSSTLRYFSLPMWGALSEARLNEELEKFPQVKRHWQHLQDQAKVAATTAPSSSSKSKGAAPPSSPVAEGSGKKRKVVNNAGVRVSPEQATEVTPSTFSSLLSSKTDHESDSTFVSGLLNLYIKTVEDISLKDPTTLRTKALSPVMRYLERFSEFIVDLLSQLPTRRFFNTLLDDMHILVRCRRSSLFTHSDGKLFSQLVGMMDTCMHFEVHDQTGRALTPQDMMTIQNTRIHKLQTLAFTHFNDTLRDLVFSSAGELAKSDTLRKHFELLTTEQLIDIAGKLGRLSERDLESFYAPGEKANAPSTQSIVKSSITLLSPVEFLEDSPQRSFILDVLIDALSERRNQLETLNRLSLYPSEELLWDQYQVPLENTYSSDYPLALPKLNLQFLTIHDYLLRNFILFRLESAFEIREDIIDSIKRMGPKSGAKGTTLFGGWARMALPIFQANIDEVSKPQLGETIPGHVHCTIEVDLSRFSGEIRQEWEALRDHDVIFMTCIEDPEPEAIFDAENSNEMSKKQLNKKMYRENKQADIDFPSKFGVKYVRGGEVFEMRDEDDVPLNDPFRPDERKGGRVGNKRKIRVRLDPAQYYADMRDGHDCYSRLNLLIRRKPKENTFKAILETIRDLMNTPALNRAIPSWLHDVFLGYGSPKAANYRSIQSSKSSVESGDYVDSFLDAQHVIESFPNATVTFKDASGTVINPNPLSPQSLKKTKKTKAPTSSSSSTSLPPPPYRLQIKPLSSQKRKESDSADHVSEEIVVTHYDPLNPGPYPEDQPPRNRIRFTPVQIEAVRSGMNPGLTMVVGPPGTGKTDVAVQIISTLYHNNPTQKILLVTHSNAALNDLFEKIMERDVDPRHLLRLGSGEKDLRETLAVGGAGGGGRGEGEAFSKQGRVDWTLSRRMMLLQQVQRLGGTIGVGGDVGYTCETAEYFRLEHIQSRIEKFFIDIASSTSSVATPSCEMTTDLDTALPSSSTEIAAEDVIDAESVTVTESVTQKVFPFKVYFSDTPKQLFNGDPAVDLAAAEGCFRHICKLFEELSDYRAFELLRTRGHRSDYLLTKQARIVAMTCTHAAMTRRRLVELGFQYDSLVMEEAAQVLEVETLIPMLLQNAEVTNSDNGDGVCRLKRIVLIGDHYQLPPVVKHMAFQKHAHLDQSLFTRFIRLGVPAVLLDKQGRARPEIAALYSWRYNKVVGNLSLGNLPNVSSASAYKVGNSGFLHTFQLVDVPAFKGKGEFCPTPYFYQNLGEAEYVVGVFMYMRLLGYPAEKISIITTYNGQKHLIRDIIAQRCKGALFGRPAIVTTVDKYQGQQNDYVLLSLVRTEGVGHVRDVRRMVVALSRARLGLYVFCRKALFANCYELAPAFSQLLSKPTQLQVIGGDSYPTLRDGSGPVDPASILEVEGVTAMGVLVYQMVQQSQQMRS